MQTLGVEAGNGAMLG